MAKNDETQAEVIRAGGNPPEYSVYDGRTDTVRAMTAEERKAADEAVKDEESAAKARRKVLETAGVGAAVIGATNTEPGNAP